MCDLLDSIDGDVLPAATAYAAEHLSGGDRLTWRAAADWAPAAWSDSEHPCFEVLRAIGLRLEPRPMFWVETPDLPRDEWRDWANRVAVWGESEGVRSRWVISRNRALVDADPDAIATLPKPGRSVPASIQPVVGPIARMWDLVADDRGTPVAGSRHWAPGTAIYVHPPSSGDGWARTKMSGRHRQHRRFYVTMAPTRRLVRWRVGRVFHPAWVAQIRSVRGAGQWEGRPNLHKLLVDVDARAAARVEALRARWRIPPPLDLGAIRNAVPLAVAEVLGTATVSPWASLRDATGACSVQVQGRRLALRVRLPSSLARMEITAAPGKQTAAHADMRIIAADEVPGPETLKIAAALARRFAAVTEDLATD